MKSLIFSVLMMVFGFFSGAEAKVFAVPDKNPAFAITVPDSWEDDESEYGYTFESPDGGIYFSIEYAGSRGTDKMIEANFAWMKEQNIIPQGEPMAADLDVGGSPGKVFRFNAKDDDGDTIVELVMIDAGNNRLVMLTLWGTEKAQQANKADLDLIKASLKSIK